MHYSNPFPNQRFSFDELEKPIVGAPMVGGSTTPELVAAVSNDGG